MFPLGIGTFSRGVEKTWPTHGRKEKASVARIPSSKSSIRISGDVVVLLFLLGLLFLVLHAAA